MLLPTGTNEAEKHFGLVDRVLCCNKDRGQLSEMAIERITYYCAQGKRKDLVLTNKTIEIRDLGGLSRRLLESKIRILILPVFVVALGRKVDIETG